MIMVLAKRFGLMISRAALSVGSGMLLLTAIGGTAYSITITPEIDPASMTTAVTLLLGSVLVVTGRRKLS
jgi:hypothetical protein